MVGIPIINPHTNVMITAATKFAKLRLRFATILLHNFVPIIKLSSIDERVNFTIEKL